MMRFYLFTGVAVLALAQGALAQTQWGGAGADALTGTEQADVLYGDPLAGTGAPVTMEKLSVVQSGGQTVDSDGYSYTSGRPEAFSKDGKKLVFQSAATNLIAGLDTKGFAQIYIKDLESGAYTLVSGTAINGQLVAGNGYSISASLSPDGKKVVFVTTAANLLGADPAGQYQIAVKNLETGALTVLSRRRVADADQGQLGSNYSYDPVFSPDGGMVMFSSFAGNLVSQDGSSSRDIFLVPYTGAADDYKKLVIASANAQTVQGNNHSYFPVFAPDGKSIAFASGANNLLTDANGAVIADANVSYDIFVKVIPADAFTSGEIMAGAVALVSADANGGQGVACNNSYPIFAPDGERIAFTSYCDTLAAGDTNNAGDILIKARKADGSWQQGDVTLVSKTAGGAQASGGLVYSPQFAPDGSKLVFFSTHHQGAPVFATSSYSCSGTCYYEQVYLKDLSVANGMGALVQLSHAHGNPATGADEDSSYPLFTPDGSGVVFTSGATNLTTPPDGSAYSDLFLATLPPSPGGNDTLTGLGGDDALYGGPGNDTLEGGAGNDLLDGGAGGDTLDGSGGDDVYVIDDAGDQVIEAAGEGDDTIEASISYALPANVEKLNLVGTAALNGTGNGLANVLIGNGGSNTLDGGADDDTLDGGEGADTMTGGTGNDIYYVDTGDDQVIEAQNEGTDEVFTSVNYTLPDHVENLSMSGNGNTNGTGNDLSNTLKGNGGNNILNGLGDDDSLYGFVGKDILDGGPGDDQMYGGLGDDIYYVDSLNDLVIENANEGYDVVYTTLAGYTAPPNVEKVYLAASPGNDTLTGTPGPDSMAGGLGDDTYVVNHTGDEVIESAGDGTDTVEASIPYTLPDHVENLTLTGTGDINGTGNGLANVLTGNAGKNRLDGGTGADTMAGAAGDDTYVVDNSGDKVVELPNQGTDTVEASIPYTLPAHVEKLTLTGTGDINGTGNDLANVLIGNAGKNVLKGGKGKDTLTGGAGADIFIFTSPKDSPAKKSKRDVITDFATNDKIDLRGLDANAKKKGKQRFSFIGGKGFTRGKAGQLRYAKGVLYGEVTGDGRADFAIIVKGAKVTKKRLILR